VTFADWDACVAERGCTHRPSDQSWGRGRRPAIDVSWNDATQQYLPWLSRKAGKTYRLLTEAEWEYAARAGATARYHFGDNERDLCTFGNVADLTGKQKYTTWEFVNCRDGHIETAPVGSFRPNAFGLHDVHGNVWEWVQDCWNDNYDGAPSDGSARTTGNCGHRVVRGGSWGHFPRYLRASGRKGDPVGVRWNDYGFRIARTL
jgi:formylglycine-generating enzyme required for sulfatase activity